MNSFRLRGFRRVYLIHIEKPEIPGTKTAGHLLGAGATNDQRAHLSNKTGIPIVEILELVKPPDLVRLSFPVTVR
jgi:hypothetical protein